MTVTLQFDSESEHAEAVDALCVNEYKAAIYAIQDKLRSLTKWGEYEHDETMTVLYDLRDFVADWIADTPMGNE